MYTNVKICGVTQPEEVKLLDEFDVAYAGLWHGFKSGRYELNAETVSQLSSIATQNLKFVLVTMLQDMLRLSEIIDKGTISAIQLHGFELPAFVQKIKQQFGETVSIFKVLHIHNNRCMEEALIERYIDAGVDVFILDSYQDRHNIGSTGIPLSDHFLDSFLCRWKLNDQIMIAGGVDEHNIESLYQNHIPYGVDIDSSAKRNGLIDRQRISQIMTRQAPPETFRI